jgi:replicative superfamily II helicase
MHMTKKRLFWSDPIRKLIKSDFDELYPFQKEALEAFEQGKDVFVKSPTGTGKTTIPLICATFVLRLGKRCVIAVPTKRLIDQTDYKVRKWFEEKYQIVKVSGAHKPSYKQIREADILVTTYESYYNLLVKHDVYRLLNQVGLVVIDELHYMGKRDSEYTRMVASCSPDGLPDC